MRKTAITRGTLLTSAFLIALITGPIADAQPASIDIKGAPIPIQILAQSPAETTTDLQVICLFRSSPLNTLHGSLTETNEKLKGLLERVRKQELFRGELGETLLVAPPKDSLGAKRLLIIGLGDSQSFSPQRMQLVGEVLYMEAGRIGVTHPFFAPTSWRSRSWFRRHGVCAQPVPRREILRSDADPIVTHADSHCGILFFAPDPLEGFRPPGWFVRLFR